VFLLAACGPARALDRGVLVQALQLPKITLNLNVTFSTSDLRIPPSADPEADIKKLQAELKTAPRPASYLQMGRLLNATGQVRGGGGLLPAGD